MAVDDGLHLLGVYFQSANIDHAIFAANKIVPIVPELDEIARIDESFGVTQ